VTPRPYQPVERQRGVDAGRERIVNAACELLDAAGEEAFSIDAVAKRAGVARMTIYNQFESKAGLLEAIFDRLAQRGAFGEMADLFRERRDPLEALDAFVALFGRFWTDNRRVHRRLRSAAMDDPDLAGALMARNERRRQGLTELVRRLGPSHTAPVPAGELVNVLFVLLSFQTFDALAGEGRTPKEITPLVQRLVRLAIGAPVE
jgi:AcrR family transcriptional regulator